VFRKVRKQHRYRRTTLGAINASCLAVMRRGQGAAVIVTGGLDGRLSIWDLDKGLAGRRGQARSLPKLIDIETEVAIESLAITLDETIVTSTLNGLAAFKIGLPWLDPNQP
jgi:hypothetical protein